MANITFSATLGNFGKLGSFIDAASLWPNPFSENANMFLLNDNNSAGVEFNGSGFQYSSNIPVTGTIANISFLDSSQNSLLDVTGLSLQVADLTAALLSRDPAKILGALTNGNDLVTGSNAKDDLRLAAGNGNDTIHGGGGGDRIAGGAGADHIYGDGGNDMLTGGAGKDAFIFAVGDGQDTITDFADTGSLRDDMLWVTKAMYAAMHVTEVTNSVTHVTSAILDFGNGDTVTIRNEHAVDIGRDDFHFYL
jgi:Ca2+-binding RTX toxin-like protein